MKKQHEFIWVTKVIRGNGNNGQSFAPEIISVSEIFTVRPYHTSDEATNQEWTVINFKNINGATPYGMTINEPFFDFVARLRKTNNVIIHQLKP